jgi:hypothetical protein
MDNMPNRLWVTAEDFPASWAGSFRRFNASDLEHEGEEYPRYVRADIVERLADALRAQVYTHGPVSEDALDLLDMFSSEEE